ncbi:Monooxygenase asqM [Hyphodiscus hymeniophilus]|uniref:Monooxygenase asqM n=1 Tax=Hyphodiscus hymeniophilus TaxID=353542 RepID=A0A9P7AW83_9HELO|nr:Monooxygenase asqM [Hyphodiscus hymeniophilus]
MSSSIPNIAIIGAGPGGLTLAAILQRNSIPFTVYDLDASPHGRNQGGTLDLHPQGGQLALRAAGLWDEFVKYARPESDVMKVVTPAGKVLWDGNGPNARVVEAGKEYDHRPEIDREKLKKILLEAVEGSRIKWGKKLLEVKEAGEGSYDLVFGDGETERGFDLVVGADGAWSKVRKVLSDEMPFYSGISGVEFWADNADEKHPFVSEFVGAGSMFSFDEGRAIQAQRLGSGTIRTYGNVRVPENFFKECGIDWEKKDQARNEFVERYFGDCADVLKRLLMESGDDLVLRTLYMLPVGFKWEEKRGVTLLGDAAHLMTPFAGVGVNAAMWDGLDLASGIVESVKGGKPLDVVVKEYETEMFSRGEKFAQKTMRGLKGHFSAHGNGHFVERLKGGE